MGGGGGEVHVNTLNDLKAILFRFQWKRKLFKTSTFELSQCEQGLNNSFGFRSVRFILPVFSPFLTIALLTGSTAISKTFLPIISFLSFFCSQIKQLKSEVKEYTEQVGLYKL